MPAMRHLGRGRIGAQKVCRRDRLATGRSFFASGPDLSRVRGRRRACFAIDARSVAASLRP
jgi:hypothetical protein